MTLTDLLTNVTAMASQTPGRVRTLRSGIGILGSAGEQWDEKLQTFRLPSADEFLAKVLRGIGPGRQHAGYGIRRYFRPEEARKLVHHTRHVARAVRREHPHLA